MKITSTKNIQKESKMDFLMKLTQIKNKELAALISELQKAAKSKN